MNDTLFGYDDLKSQFSALVADLCASGKVRFVLLHSELSGVGKSLLARFAAEEMCRLTGRTMEKINLHALELNSADVGHVPSFFQSVVDANCCALILEDLHQLFYQLSSRRAIEQFFTLLQSTRDTFLSKNQPFVVLATESSLPLVPLGIVCLFEPVYVRAPALADCEAILAGHLLGHFGQSLSDVAAAVAPELVGMRGSDIAELAYRCYKIKVGHAIKREIIHMQEFGRDHHATVEVCGVEEVRAALSDYKFSVRVSPMDRACTEFLSRQ
eukprot:GILI01010964.1.p1 GENE.GILI01010964.1~~GILI01010964.1.p1  ORF type:complete len:271 (+),score=22.79 GILI01010964.1:44-856(+)